ncbi:amidohydrolase [Phaeobacter gallaeciensis]|uniref:Amidohydrolase n=1 Tax=Phaeobacter gallaeciensis TaxID=60890 RepID=A0AAC9Z992_9RHOB|nr:amidohydrolase [Phaeobacter gallaeciensis]AHD09685.1 amidohydrolase [Phaeobacter gallaeciensis DSM 26640]ATE92949.1 amidohydrolase [Phaeobacter gallaeciensis]ATE97229.1 amidohydrolase [Phaeobacter gallaeciensis]ATF01614.1 amidohydrolase [Phaeobacter gallaeciensis]ATF05994.1 amidohydrolase [Phaeobacter gallaeciensis]
MTPDRLAQLMQLRHALHQIPEVSGAEEKTAAFITGYLRGYDPDQLLTGLGGHGVAAVYDGVAEGPTVMIRCELDGLPIEEISDQPYRSTHAGRGHLCGHDGHMTIVAALAEELAARRPARGRAVLLFQPAEETGQGARAVLADSRFAQIAPDYAFSLHNLPGRRVGDVALCSGAANCASRGMRIRLTGKTSHAAAPQDGISPAGAMAQLLSGLVALGGGGDLGADYALVTLTHARLGEATFGIAPGEGEVWATLRTVNDARMERLIAEADDLIRQICAECGLGVEISFDDVFEACTNDGEAVAILQTACRAAGHPVALRDQPQRWSEDFGQFGKSARAAMVWLGSGEMQPQLHNPDYDFPDDAIPVGVSIFASTLKEILG